MRAGGEGDHRPGVLLDGVHPVAADGTRRLRGVLLPIDGEGRRHGDPVAVPAGIQGQLRAFRGDHLDVRLRPDETDTQNVRLADQLPEQGAGEVVQVEPIVVVAEVQLSARPVQRGQLAEPAQLLRVEAVPSRLVRDGVPGHVRLDPVPPVVAQHRAHAEPPETMCRPRLLPQLELESHRGGAAGRILGWHRASVVVIGRERRQRRLPAAQSSWTRLRHRRTHAGGVGGEQGRGDVLAVVIHRATAHAGARPMPPARSGHQVDPAAVGHRRGSLHDSGEPGRVRIPREVGHRAVSGVGAAAPEGGLTDEAEDVCGVDQGRRGGHGAALTAAGTTLRVCTRGGFSGVSRISTRRLPVRPESCQT